jgi:Protein-glutamine gamma-glutamyltransferase
MNLREFWAAEAAKLRDTSALLDTSSLSFMPPSKDNVMSMFQVNIIIMSKLIFNKVKFGSNGERNIKGYYDKRFWETNGPVGLKLKVGEKPSSAIHSIINNTSGTQTLDCAQYVEAVRLGAMLLTDGESTFNQRFKTGLIFRSHESTGNEIDKTYLRTMVDTFDMDRYFAIDNDPNKIIFDTQEKLLNQAPIGSRITVTNFTIHEILNYKEYNCYCTTKTTGT